MHQYVVWEAVYWKVAKIRVSRKRLFRIWRLVSSNKISDFSYKDD